MITQCNRCPNPNYPCWCILHPENNMSESGKIKKIKREVAGRHGITVADLESKSRTQKIYRARQAAMQRCRNETKATLELIGRSFNRAHSTVLSAIRKP